MKIRRGFSLIEMILTMSVGSALMVLAMSLLQQAMTLSTQARDQREADSTMNRLCDQFRRDLHEAKFVNVDQGRNVSMQVDNQVITYNFHNHRVSRKLLDEVRLINGKEAGEPSQREIYDVGASSEFSIEKLDSPQRVVLTIRRSSPLKHLEPRIDRQISAVVGRLDVDFLRSEVQ